MIDDGYGGGSPTDAEDSLLNLISLNRPREPNRQIFITKKKLILYDVLFLAVIILRLQLDARHRHSQLSAFVHQRA